MNRNLFAVPIIVVSTITASVTLGQSGEDRALPTKEEPSLNRFRVSCRLAYNISAHLENFAIAPTQTSPQPPAPLDPSKHFVSVTGATYQDGYVGIDISTNVGHRTWYWGYENSDQIVGGTNGFLALADARSGTLLGDFKNDPLPGLEVSYGRQLGENNGTRWGMEAALTYLNLDLRAKGIADPNVLAVDAFPLLGIVPPLAGYAGTFEGPAALIGDTPTRYPANIVSEVDAAVYGLKLGPYLESPLSKRVSFTLGGGFALLLVDSEFRIQQSATIPLPGNTSGTFRRTITDSDLGLLPAAYIAGNLAVAVSDSMTIFTGLEYESGFWSHSHGVADKRATIDLANAIFLSFGFSYSF